MTCEVQVNLASCLKDRLPNRRIVDLMGPSDIGQRVDEYGTYISWSVQMRCDILESGKASKILKSFEI